MGEMQTEAMLRDEIATEIVHLSRRLMQRTARAMESLNVGFGQAAILKVLSDHGEMAQRRLAEEIRVTPATVCGTLKRMERAGLIERSAADGDARVSLVRLSDEGQRRFAAASSAIERTYREMMDGFSDDECQLILGVARRMGQNLTGGAEEQTNAHRND